MSLHSVFHTITFFSVVIASHLFFYSLSIHARKATWSVILITRCRAAWNALGVLNSFKLALFILVNLAYFLDAIFFTFSRIISCYVSSRG